MREECGVVGVSLSSTHPHARTAATLLYYALYGLQHRGQESAGISVQNGGIATRKGMGLVSEALPYEQVVSLKSSVGIGHVRYSTTGASEPLNSQPLEVGYRGKRLALAHNGNLVNTETLRDELERGGAIFLTGTDSEIIAQLLTKELRHRTPLEAIKRLMGMLVGSYSLVILLDGVVYAVRDPMGIKPLCFGEVEGGFMVASESVALDSVSGALVDDVQPGEVVVLRDGHLERHVLHKGSPRAHCVFEYIYFARADSTIDGRLVYDVRERIGRRLAHEHPVEADIVSPIPDSGIAFALGYSKESRIEYKEGLMKNRYIGRTFIMPAQNSRELAVRLKMNAIAKNIKGQRVVLVDDSIVRGTTSRRIVDMVRAFGAKSVHLIIGSPPIVSPCYLGVDMPTREELIASAGKGHKKALDEIRKELHADSIGYLSIEGLVDAIGIDEDDLCMGCLTGVYPVEIPNERCKYAQVHLNDY
ncbi:MAG: amidophosphoribosyltransferase [Methermicoccaceae archaeon]